MLLKTTHAQTLPPDSLHAATSSQPQIIVARIAFWVLIFWGIVVKISYMARTKHCMLLYPQTQVIPIVNRLCLINCLSRIYQKSPLLVFVSTKDLYNPDYDKLVGLLFFTVGIPKVPQAH